MLSKKLLLTFLINTQNVFCHAYESDLKEIDRDSNLIDESELFELMEPINPQFRQSNSTSTESNATEPDAIPFVAAITGLVVAPIILAAIAPPALPTFSSQGAPQPGTIIEGGGVLPVPAISVIKNFR